MRHEIVIMHSDFFPAELALIEGLDEADVLDAVKALPGELPSEPLEMLPRRAARDMPQFYHLDEGCEPWEAPPMTS